MKKVSQIPLLLVLFFFGALAHAQINVSTNIIIPTVELIWEAHSYIPPLYKGKALYPVSGEVTVLALPPAAMGDPAALEYTWKRNGTVDGDRSGIGRRSYTFIGSQFGDTPTVVVEVKSGRQSAHGVLRLSYQDPIIRFYENRPLEGVAFEHALRGSITTDTEGVVVEAYPFYAGEESREDGNLNYSWSYNSRTLLDAFYPSIFIRSDEPTTAHLQLSVGHDTHILQRTSQSLSVVIEEK